MMFDRKNCHRNVIKMSELLHIAGSEFVMVTNFSYFKGRNFPIASAVSLRTDRR
jgi:hypothetical protein